MSDFLYQLHQALLAHNVHIIGHINPNSDKIQRFKSRNKSSGKDIFIVLHGEQGATFGDWHDRDGWQTWWCNGRQKLNVYERREFEAQKREIERERYEKRLFAINRAEQCWLSHPSTKQVYEHPYIQRKKINPYYSKVANQRWVKDVLLIPIRDIDYQFQSVQIIKPNGFKRPWKGTTYKNNMIWLSPILPDDYKGVIRLCEGYATGCTILAAMGDVVVCALNAYNMPNVAALIRQKYPDCHLKICADNDAWGKDNIGLQYAALADVAGNGFIHYPEFSKLNCDSKPTDYNDLYLLAGLEETRRQLILIR